MNLRPDDPQLSAWLLGELSAEEAAAVERAIAADPALMMAVREMEAAQKWLTNTLAPGSAALFPRQRGQILQEARRLDSSGPRVPERPAGAAGKPVSWFFPVAMAAVLALACWLLIQLPGGGDKPLAGGPDRSAPDGPSSASTAYWPSPAPGESAPAQPGSSAVESVEFGLKLPRLLPRRAVSAAEAPVLTLPVQAGRHSLGWITRAVREENRLPALAAVRFEEILNHFPLRPAGPVTVSQGVTVTAEAVACPWRPSSRLLVVTLRGAGAAAREVSVIYRPHAPSVREYRLLGYDRVEGAPEMDLPRTLAAGAVHSVVLEIQPGASAVSYGAIEWSVDGQAAADLPLVPAPDAEPSDDVRFAALTACFCQWLGDASSRAGDRDILLALVRELQAPGLPADRADFLRLVEQAAGLVK